MPHTTPACPQCAQVNTYPDGDNFVCADCGHEWPMAATQAADDDADAVVKDSNGQVLQDGDAVLTQSLAIMEYLDEAYPDPALMPRDAIGRAQVRALALTLACDVHPLGNLRVLNHLSQNFGADEPARAAWVCHWMALGFEALEQHLQQGATGMFCHGDTPTLADCCLVPQVFNARRFGLDLAPYPTLQRIAQHCEALPAFAAAHPAQQPDAPVPETA